MELNERLLAEIAEIFREVQFGEITFYITPDKWQLNYSVKTQGKLPIEKPVKRQIVLDRK